MVLETISSSPKNLPIYHVKKKLMAAIENNPVLVITGETGSGKSTQIAQYLHQKGHRKIVVTQPRRVGAISLATRVAEEMKVKLGEKVGYAVRFDDCSSRSTEIKYMTDGCLLRECLADKNLFQYNVLILDEAHERSLQTDILFGLLTTAAKNRIKNKNSKFRLIITSATLNTKKFCSFFQCKSFQIPGRTFPVTIKNIDEAPRKYTTAAIETVLEIHRKQPAEGHILVFLTGREEIEDACDLLGRKVDSLIDEGVELADIVILPAYSTLRVSEQKKIFYSVPKNCRKVVFATNIAETSLTVPGVRFVIDCGFVKQKIYNERTRIDSLTVVPISCVAAVQRAGRAGRTCPGVCYRLYSKENFAKMEKEPTPEMQRSSLLSVLLLLKALRIDDPFEFRFMDRPTNKAVEEGLRSLFYFDALDRNGKLTFLGKEMSRFPLDPSLAKLMLCALRFGCEEQMLTITSLLSVEKMWVHYTDKESLAALENARKRFRAREGDHLSMLNVYRAWEKSGFSRRWAEQNHLHYWNLVQARRVRGQLKEIIDRISSSFDFKRKSEEFFKGKPEFTYMESSKDDEKTRCRKVLANVMFMNCCRFVETNKRGNVYRIASDFNNETSNRKGLEHFWMHKSCAMFETPPEWVVYDHVLFTSKPFIQQVTKIRYEWVCNLLPKLEDVDIERLCGKKNILENKTNENGKFRSFRGIEGNMIDLSTKATNSVKVDSFKKRYLERKAKKAKKTD